MVTLYPGAEAPSEPMVRLLVQVKLPQKESQLPAPPSAAKQQSSAPRAAVSVSHCALRWRYFGSGTLELPLTAIG